MKRKEFFKLASAGAAGLTLATSCSKSAQRAVEQTSATEIKKEIPSYRNMIKSSFSTAHGKAPSDRVILALIGAGGYGSRLSMKAARFGENVQIKYICDVDDTRGGWAESELEEIQGFKPQKVRDMRKVFDDEEVDGVFIATPEHWHALATIWACQAGKDVYVEKPISHSIFEGQQMIKAAMKYERIVQCGTQNRIADYAFTARDYIKSGELGDIYAVHVRSLSGNPVPFNPGDDLPTPDTLDWDMWLGPAPKVPYNVSRHRSWYYYWDYGSGFATGGDSIHQLDLARLIIGDPGFPESVYCAGGRYFFDDNRDVPDYQMATFDYGDFVLTLETGQGAPYLQGNRPEERLGDEIPRWMQHSTRIKILGSEKMMYAGRMGAGWQVFDRDEKLVAQDTGYYPLEPHVVNFIDCIRSREKPMGDIVEGHNSNVLIHLANMSYRAGNKQLQFSPEYETILNDEKAASLIRRNYREGFEITDHV
ncbi:MAG: Gfo/Idh/MocA family oxidoreductase [Balneolaceae bacterium]|nr:Gfo/Idh/MocA family oxidoreductase [Balneolaceae bacterium]